jgi:hypothetical protein
MFNELIMPPNMFIQPLLLPPVATQPIPGPAFHTLLLQDGAQEEGQGSQEQEQNGELQ